MLKYEIDQHGNYIVSNTQYIQSDYDRPALAMQFGWRPCHTDTDGTVDCTTCGTTATELIQSATEFLDEHEGEEVETE